MNTLNNLQGRPSRDNNSSSPFGAASKIRNVNEGRGSGYAQNEDIQDEDDDIKKLY